MVFLCCRFRTPMATSTLCQSSSLSDSTGNPRSCLYLPRQQTFQPKADWHASFTNTNKEQPFTGLSPTKPLILRQQHNGAWLSNFSASPTNDLNPQPQPETLTSLPKPAVNDLTGRLKSSLRLVRTDKTLRCHVCHATIKEQHFQNHLFFGGVRCDLCQLVCGDCRSFELHKKETERGRSSCKHSFSYSDDPYEYLLPRLSGSDDMDVGGSLTLPNKQRVLQHYVNQLTDLQLLEPWCTAVRKCKSRLLKARTAMLTQPLEDVGVYKDSLNKDGDSLSVEDDTHGSSAPLSESNGWNSSFKTMLKGYTCPSPALRESQEEKDTDTGVLLTQSYDLEQLEQAVEYVELKGQCKLGSVQSPEVVQSKPKKRRKTCQHKKLKTQKFSHKKKRLPIDEALTEVVDNDESDLVMEKLALPENGYYLMVREAVEQCPMCYESLSENNCSVNLRTFLFTLSCPGCGLLIYIVPDLPDGLKIVMDGGGEKIMQTQHNKPQKTTRKIRPQDFFSK